jgi:hypothetical protein
MTDPVPSKDRLAELIADYQLRYDDRDCKCDSSDETVCKCCRGLCVCHYDFDTIAALKQLQKPAHEREPPHCSTWACHACDPYDSATTCDQCERDADRSAPEPCARHGQIIQTDCPDCERALGRLPEPPLRPDGMPEPSLDVLKRVAARMRETAPDTAYLAEWAADQIEEHNQSFDLRWKADMRAIKRWQEAHPGNDLTWPDHADLCVWLLEQLDAIAAQPPRDG